MLGLAGSYRLFGRVVLVSLLGLGGIPSASAQTAISGSLSSDTRWTLAGGPYVLTGTVTVNSGVVLTIDPGVVLYMAPAAELSVRGTLKAQGTAAAPIKVLSDKVLQGLPAMPGDWKRWVFEAGSSDQTRLDYVTFENGSGLAVFGSAPVFNNLDIRNQAAPAMAVDLAASPSGVGNKASGNTLNGIAVPAGEIGGTVKWGLKGIPYLVTGAGVGIGAAPTLTTLSPNTVEQGDKVIATVSGTRLGGLADVAFDPVGIEASVQSNTSTSANVSLTVPVNAPPGAVTLRAVADAGKVELPAALTVEAMKAPVVNGMTPRAVNRGTETSMLITGTSLSAARVSTSTNGMSIAGETPSKTALSFRLGVGANVPSGIYQLNVSNPAGSQLVNVEVIAEATPQSDFRVLPPLIGLPVDTTKFRQAILRAPQTSTTERRFNVSISNTTIATASSNELVLPAGQYEAAIGLKGLKVGSTVMAISGGGMPVPLEVPVTVTTTELGQTQISQPVGVFKGGELSNGTGFFVTPPLGVVRGNPFYSSTGFYSSAPVSVHKGNPFNGGGGNGVAVAPQVGVVRVP